MPTNQKGRLVKVGRAGRTSLSSLSTYANSSLRDRVLNGHRQDELATFFFFKTSFSFQLWSDGNLPIPDTPRETRAVERYWLFLEAVHGAAGELLPALGRERDPGRGNSAQVRGAGSTGTLRNPLSDFRGVWKPRESGATGDPP